MKPNLKLAMAAVDNDFSKETADAEHAADVAVDAAADEIESETAASNRTLIKRSKAWLAKKLSTLSRHEEALQVRIATAKHDRAAGEASAKAAYEAALETAKAAYDAEMTDVEADLFQITECKEALSLAHGRLMKAEL